MAVLLALVAGIVGTTWGMVSATDAKAEAVEAAKETRVALSDKAAALAAAQKSERTRSEQLWQSLVAQARALRLSHRSGQHFQSLETLGQATQLARTLNLPAPYFHELRNAVIAALAVPDLYLTGPWNSWPADALRIDFDEAHSILARTDRSGSCSIRRMSNDTEIFHLPGSGAPAVPLLSRDGKFIALTRLDPGLNVTLGIDVWQLDGSAPRQLMSESNTCRVAFRDSQEVALAYSDGAIRFFELPTTRQMSYLSPDTLTVGIWIAVHPTEPLVAVASYFGTALQLRDVRTGKVLASLPQTIRPVTMAWHPNGRTLAVGYENQRLCLVDRSTWQVYRTLDAQCSANSLNFDRTGNRIALQAWGNVVEVIDVGTGEVLMQASPTVAACRFSRDGLRLAGADQNGKVGTWQLAGAEEFRTLVRNKAMAGSEDCFRCAAVHPDGRLLACGMEDGLGLWDLVTGTPLAFVPMNRVKSVLFERSGALLTLSLTGLSRWPIDKGLESTGELSIGPPEPLRLSVGSSLSESHDGRVIASCDRAVSTEQPFAGGWILHPDSPKEPIRLDLGADMAFIAVSPDGRWVVTATFGAGLAKIWDARDGRLVKLLANWGVKSLCFSPDGRWLATSLDGGRLFAVETWAPGPQVGEGAVFSPDSKLTAAPTSNGIRLIDPATGREVALLEDPNREPVDQAVFSPDGTKLVVVNLRKGIHAWDLRLIRRQLKDRGLDWDWPEFPPATAPRSVAEPVKVRIRLVPESTSKAALKPPATPRGKPGS